MHGEPVVPQQQLILVERTPGSADDPGSAVKEEF